MESIYNYSRSSDRGWNDDINEEIMFDDIDVKVTGYLELYDFVYVYIYATKTGILKS